MQFLEIFVRQSHPGPLVPAYESYEQKMSDALIYKESEEIPWQVLVDDLEGRVHQAYGGLSNPTYVVNSEGRIAFYDIWSHAPSVYRALEDLTRTDGACVVSGGIDRTPHVMAYMINGWRGLERGLPQSYSDLQKAVPGVAPVFKFGYKIKPVLGPVALRAKPFRLKPREIARGAGAYISTKLITSR